MNPNASDLLLHALVHSAKAFVQYVEGIQGLSAPQGFAESPPQFDLADTADDGIELNNGVPCCRIHKKQLKAPQKAESKVKLYCPTKIGDGPNDYCKTKVWKNPK